MKKLLFAVCALAAISMLAPSAGFAQWENRIGIYSAADANAATTHAYIESPALFTPTNIYWVISNPMMNGTPVTQFDGYELTASWSPSAPTHLGDVFPSSALDVDGASWGYAVGFATPLTVTNGQTLLCTTSVMLLSAGTLQAFLHPATVPSLADVMAITVPDGMGGATLVACSPSSGDFDDADADFALGAQTVGVEYETFGAVKSLFR